MAKKGSRSDSHDDYKSPEADLVLRLNYQPICRIRSRINAL
jgi:hypothetical protein